MTTQLQHVFPLQVIITDYELIVLYIELATFENLKETYMV